MPTLSVERVPNVYKERYLELVVELISLFSGIGGLEHPEIPPALVCEQDEIAQQALSFRFPKSALHSDVRTLKPPRCDAVLGGWPCQDISVAGKGLGLKGENSALFYELVRVATESKARAIVAENVPNLLSLQGGTVFEEVLSQLHQAGYPFVSWRRLNAREFGLPHQRRRVFIVASKDEPTAWALHRPITAGDKVALKKNNATESAAGFYWTAGTRSLNYSVGYSPTLKVGTALSIPSPIALHVGARVRRATGGESLALQGFTAGTLPLLSDSDALRLAGNAVARPVGEFVAKSLDAEGGAPPLVSSFGAITKDGFSGPDGVLGVQHPDLPLAHNLVDFLAPDADAPLGARAAAGLVSRLNRSGLPCPSDLWELLLQEASLEVAQIGAHREPQDAEVVNASQRQQDLFAA